MINKLIKLLLCLTISFSVAQDSANSTKSTSKYVNVKIEGMHCAGGCAKSIERQLNNTDGVTAMVSFANSQALIEYDKDCRELREAYDHKHNEELHVPSKIVIQDHQVLLQNIDCNKNDDHQLPQ